ncbi:adenylate/guanylate cyclase domain-containing response regulator [Leptospira levettii]|uniref:Adenylate/guanylate cyclase domain-containing response regulator n=1 Tax=Leptospira levettii TaxID=2023178 RepID=A0A2N0AY72_9LEPT|nr:adenylate/guanylate cyclase domain-containing response regulator [Leptospira levettii]MCW7467133.1 adenylate/guanylate cyclase domain-containing response regulator [Leptospira levettii]MCW7497750.1 adenylate/guanylate cyclase domain-containing response regulator [Leptospira levettii]MCW7506344.1 adenylate/guanylate cyclase domain-containing response regulator [Leptospira levettii]MCW7512855.1 adenylate/guanylate cyclase domain-containing response regulator [Leptospira levettii]MCW7516577.1 
MELEKEEIVRVLVLEPQKKSYDTISQLLVEWFGEYIELTWRSIFENGAEEIKKVQYDLLITEIQFPELEESSESILEKIMDMAGPSELPVVVFTKAEGKQLPILAFQLGINEYFSKRRLKKNILEHRFRNLFREIYRKKVVSIQMDDSLKRFQDLYGMNQSEIQDLNTMVKKFKKELEKEYEEKLSLEFEKKKMQNVFGMYVDPIIVESLMNNTLSLDQKGKEQEVSVLFSDIRGYTSLSEKMKPEHVISFLNEYFTAMTEVILGYGGMIDKYIGDSIMCLFGAPVFQEDHRQNALDCALEMLQVFELWQPKWNQIYGFTPQIGIGVASGNVIVGNVGSFQKLSYTAVGDTVNMASRLESMAKPMHVYVSEGLYNHLPEEYSKKYRYEELEPVKIKGKEGLHRILSVKPN